MQSTTMIEYAYRLIETGYADEARRTLASMLQTDPNDAGAWALSAWVAPDSERCQFALRKVVELSQSTSLSDWASRGLLHVEHTGALGEEPPPVLAAPEPASRPSEPAEPPAPSRAGTPGYNMSQIGGGIMIVGMSIMILALVSQKASDLISSTGIAPTTCCLSLVLIGAVLAIVGYQRH